MNLALVPIPATCVQGTEPGCHIDAATPIVAAAGTRPEAEVLASQLARVFGRLPVVVDVDAGGTAIRLQRDAVASGPEEGYRLDAGRTGITITATTPAGIFRGTQTLLQLLPPLAPQGADVAAVAIADQPRFPWRGAMLDPSRHIIPVADVLRFIDLLARHRFNRLHLHLTDDQGWRIEIRRYPRLTAIGAWRSESIAGHLGARPNRFDGVPHGGYYSQDDLRHIVAYAAARHITVVPEIDLPGHMQAAIAAYPWLGNDGKDCPVFTAWGINPHILNAEERTIRFLEDVLGEVLEIFPSPWIHVGGDEAVKDEWKASPRIQERIRELGVTDEHGLQSYIIGRMDTFLTARGRRLLGWDEILEGGLSSNATVVSWRGCAGGIEAARQGHDVIMAANSHTYFDYYQHADTHGQPLAIGGLLTLEKVYGFEPIPPELTPEQARHILGSQGQLWSEYIDGMAHLEYMAFPRLCALAEVLWSPKETRDWPDFRQRLTGHLARLDALGVRYFREPAPGAIVSSPCQAERPALVVLAAGMGSRFGGDKQVAAVGPHGESILDFTVHDALRSGFAETVLVVRHDNRDLVHEQIGRRIAARMPLRYAYQDTAEPIPGLRAPATRAKPWGTAHALACALRGLQRPCGVVNADDWYSPAGIRGLARLLARGDGSAVLATYPLVRTLSAHGPVNRALCGIGKWNELTAIEETTGIIGGAEGPEVHAADGSMRRLAAEAPVSLNLWGFQPNLYAGFIADVDAWIRDHIDAASGECQLPLMVMAGVKSHGWSTRTVQVDGDWTGLTYLADRPAVQARLAQATMTGDYPSPLWG
jgi:hexosaminidase